MDIDFDSSQTKKLHDARMTCESFVHPTLIQKTTPVVFSRILKEVVSKEKTMW